MALADVKKYYKIFEQTHNDAAKDLEELKDLCRQGLVTQDKIDDLSEEFETDDYMYQFFSYIMYLWNLPRRNSKRKKVLTKDEKIREKFKLVKLTEDEQKLENENVLKNFRQKIDKIKEEEQ